MNKQEIVAKIAKEEVLNLHIVRIEVEMANRQIPGSARPVRVRGPVR